MKVVDVVVAKTSDSEEITTVAELVGKTMPTAFILNYGTHGFAKFRFDDASLRAFETNLHKIEELAERRNVCNQLYDNVKSLRVAGSQALAAIRNALPAEETEEMLVNYLKSIVPTLIKKYLPMETYEQEMSGMFEAVMQIVQSKKFFESEGTSQLLIKCLIDFAESEAHLAMINEWFKLDSFCDIKFSVEIQHLMVPKIWCSRTIPQDQKDTALERMRSIDNSDKIGLTEKRCHASVPTVDAKRAVFEKLFSDEVDKLSLYAVEADASGFR